MKTEITGVGLSVKLHYEVKEDLLDMGGVGDSGDIRLDRWSMGTRTDIMAVALKLLSEIAEDDVLVIGVVPSQKPSTGSVSADSGESGTLRFIDV